MSEDFAQRVLITGGSGFIGTNLVDHYSALRWPVLSIDSAPPRDPRHHLLHRAADVTSAEDLSSALRMFQPTLVIHAAARTDLDGKRVEDYRVNVDGVRKLICAIQDCGSVERTIFFSSRLVCRIGYQPTSDVDYCPSTAYGESKVAAEHLIRQSCKAVPWTIVRPTSIWGPWFDVPYRLFFDSIQSGRYFHVDRYRIPKSFGFVGNTVHETHRLAVSPVQTIAGRTFYLADYPPLDVGEFADAIQRAFGVSPIRRVPGGVVRAAAVAGDLLKHAGWKSVPLTSFRLNNLMTPMVHDLSSLEAIVGPLPYSMEEGVARTVEWVVTRSGRRGSR